MSKLTLFDLTKHSSCDLDSLSMAIDSGIADCGTNKGLQELKETLLAWKLIVGQAYKEAVERESDEFAAKTAKEINESVNAN
jgi:hypothetical protein